MILDKEATFHPEQVSSYDPVTHQHTVSGGEDETRIVNSTTMSGSRAWQEYGVTDLRLIRIRSFDPLPTGFDYVEVDGIRYQQIDRQQIGSITTITGKEVPANAS